MRLNKQGVGRKEASCDGQGIVARFIEKGAHVGVLERVTAACVFLAPKENARAMTGVIIHVDAGSSLRMPRRS